MYTILVASLNENMKLAKLIQNHLEAMNIQSEIINLVEPKLLVKPNKDGTKVGYSIGKLRGRRDFQWNTKL